MQYYKLCSLISTLQFQVLNKKKKFIQIQKYCLKEFNIRIELVVGDFALLKPKYMKSCNNIQ